MHDFQRRTLGWQHARVMLAAGLMAAAPVLAQPAPPCDLDIADDIGTHVWGATVHLTGRAGAGTNQGQFVMINNATAQQDVDQDGFIAGCAFNDLYIPQTLRVDLVNVEDPSIAIPGRNIIVNSLPRTLASGAEVRVNVIVELPAGTPAGKYRGQFVVADLRVPVTLTPSGERLGSDFLFVEVDVSADPEIGLLDAQTDEALDSVVVRGRAGQRVSEAFRITAAGNVRLTDIRLTATDLRSESAVGLVIPAQNISFSPASLSGIELQDTARVVVTVALPRGILGGRYRGSILVQSAGTVAQQIPLIAIVTSTRGILFTNNPVRTADGVAQIAFNGDPGSRYKVGVFDMTGRMVWENNGSVFAGIGGTPAAPTAGADFAQSVTWSLVNLRGEAVASGMYLVVVESIVNGQRTLGRDRLMVIR